MLIFDSKRPVGNPRPFGQSLLSPTDSDRAWWAERQAAAEREAWEREAWEHWAREWDRDHEMTGAWGGHAGFEEV